ncbi:hypothetical protein Sjap_018421 [Stephania japonica]|uniref:Uncharacterized protein n=1 Tax=Stephania japonica TaxID=461633 RepID=A0AAP0I7X9_9MAGN
MDNRDHLFRKSTLACCIQIMSKTNFSIFLPFFCILTFLLWHIGDECSTKIIKHHMELYHNRSDTAIHHHLKHTLRHEWTFCGATSITYFIVCILGLYLLAIASTTYSVASFYLSKEPTFKKLMRAVRRVWKKLVITFLVNFIIQFICNVVAIGLLASSFFLCTATSLSYLCFMSSLITYITMMSYFGGLTYINAVWQLASVVSVLEEDTYGFKAMKKSKELLNTEDTYGFKAMKKSKELLKGV